MPVRSAVLYRFRSTTLQWSSMGCILIVVAGWLLTGLRSIPDFIWFIAPGVLWLGWELYSSVTITAVEVIVRPSTPRKMPVRVPLTRVAVEGYYVTDRQPVDWFSLPPGTLHFSLEFTAEDNEGNLADEAIVMRYNGQQVENFLSPTHWPKLQAALLAAGGTPA